MKITDALDVNAHPLRLGHLLAIMTPFVLVGGALLFEHVGGLSPCEMCMMQRWPHLAALVLGLIALLAPDAKIRRGLVMASAGGIATSAAIAVDHLGVERRWWEGHTACTSSLPTGLSTAEYLDAMMRMPLVRCDTPQWTFAGLSLADLNAIVSGGAAIIIIVLVMRSRRKNNAAGAA